MTGLTANDNPREEIKPVRPLLKVATTLKLPVLVGVPVIRHDILVGSVWEMDAVGVAEGVAMSRAGAMFLGKGVEVVGGVTI